MKYLIFFVLFLLSVLQLDAQRREFHPTVDVGLNGGISFSEFELNNELNEKGILKQFNVNVMSNAGYSRHLFEVEYANPFGNNEFKLNKTDHYKPSVLSLNYTFGYELFGYYPACMIRNQLLLGVRLNAEFLFGDYAIENIQEGKDNLFLGDDFAQYSADISLITDYYLNKNNYIVLQVYSPLATLLSNHIDFDYRTKKAPVLYSSIQVDETSLFQDMKFVGPKSHSKIGLMATYRLLLSEYVAIQLKYHGKINSQTDYSDVTKFAASNNPLHQNHHQFMVGVVGHFTRMPIGF